MFGLIRVFHWFHVTHGDLVAEFGLESAGAGLSFSTTLSDFDKACASSGIDIIGFAENNDMILTGVFSELFPAGLAGSRPLWPVSGPLTHETYGPFGPFMAPLRI